MINNITQGYEEEDEEEEEEKEFTIRNGWIGRDYHCCKLLPVIQGSIITEEVESFNLLLGFEAAYWATYTC